MKGKAKARITVLGAGFAGMELCTLLSESLGDTIQVTMRDKSDAFVFGFSKLDVMFGRTTLDAVRLPYRPTRARTIATSSSSRSAPTTTSPPRPGWGRQRVLLGLRSEPASRGPAEILEGPCDCGSVRGALQVPAGASECALMLHDFLQTKGVRSRCEITMVLPLSSPVSPSPETSKALVAAFAERDIKFMPNRKVTMLDPSRRIAKLDDSTELSYELYLGVPRNRAPQVVEDSGMVENGWVTVNPRTLETRYPGVYACGDIANTGTPKAGVFAEGAAKAVATALIARIRGEGEAWLYDGFGSCYLEFGGGRIGRVDVDFFSGPKPTGKYYEPTVELRADKEKFGASRRARWFGL